MTFRDYTELGFFPLQDHADDGTPVSARFMLAGGRIVSAKMGENVAPEQSFVEYGRENGLGTIGDLWPWMFWQTRSREARGMGSWAQSFATVAAGADAYYGTVDAQPLRDDQYANDTRFHELRPTWPTAFSRVARGSILAVMPGTEESEQHPLALWADPRLVAPNANGPGECGTLVVDLQPTAELCMAGDRPGVDGRAARLQTLVRVLAVVPGSSLAGLGAEGNVLAINYTRTGADGIPGFGAVFAEVDTRSGGGPITPGGGRGTTGGGPITPGGSSRVGNLTAGAGAFGADGAQAAEPKCPQDFGHFEPLRTANHGVGLMAHYGGFGPVHIGAQADKHNHGTDRDGHPINAAHISVDAFFYRDADKDAPILFEGDYPHPSPLPIPAPAHISYDGTSQHAFAGGVRPGYWRLWCETPDISPLIPPVEDPPPPPPPLTPGGPRAPRPGGPGPGGPATPRGPAAPGQPPATPGGGRSTGGPGGSVPPRPGLTQPITPNPGGKRFPGYPATDPPPGGTGGPTTPGGGGTGGGSPQGPTTPGGAGGQPGTPCKTPPQGGPGTTQPTTPGGQPGRSTHGDPLPSGGTGGGRTPARGRGAGAVGEYRGGGANPRAEVLPSGAALFSAGGGETMPRTAVPGRGRTGTTVTDPRLYLGRWSGNSQTTRAPQVIPGVVEKVGRTSERRGLYTLFRPMAQGFAALNFRPQMTVLGYPNFEHNPQLPAPMFFSDEAVRPQVLAMHAFGGQSTVEAEWSYVERPENSRARGGVAAGGIVFHHPQFELEDYYGVGSAVDVESAPTTAYVLAAPGVAFALGKPAADGSLASGGVAIAQDTDDALAVEQDGVEILRAEATTSGGGGPLVTLSGAYAVRIPVGTEAERPASPGDGYLRVNSDTNRLEYYSGGSWRTLTGAT